MNNNIDVKAIRQALNLTQVELSRKLKVDAISISRWELGKQRPHPKVLKRLSRLQRKVNHGK
jgi:DNA-binding transcriptional regulator YiaG